MKLGVALVLVLTSAGGSGCVSETTGSTPDGPPSNPATFTFLYGDYFSTCKNCHSPAGPGRTSDIEKTLDFTSKATAHQTITTGMASGLTGNFAGCNTVPFIDQAPMNSLIVAVVDQPTRVAFDLPAHPSCDMDTVTDETAKVGTAPSTEFVSALKLWITSGAAND